MRKSAKIILGASAAILLSGLLGATVAQASGNLPTDEACKAKPTDPVVQGGCVILDRKKGNCMACHHIEGAALAGNIAPPLVAMKQRFPDKDKLRKQVWDASVANPRTIMSPYGRHKILTEDEIDKVVEFLLTL